jgi:hypothetical protein
MRSTTFRKFAVVGAALAMVAVLPACVFPVPNPPPGSGQFIGLGVNLTGGQADKCSWQQVNTHSIVVECKDIPFRYQQDAVVVLSFTGHGYEATIGTEDSGDIGLRWAEFAANADGNTGVVSGFDDTVVLRGGSVPNAPLWGIWFASNNILNDVNFFARITCVPQPGSLCPA